MKSNQFQIQAAKAAALRIYKKVNYSNGPLEQYQVSDLLTQVYQYLKIPFKPTSKDVKAYSEILDTNKDGKITLQDFKDNPIYKQNNTNNWKVKQQTSLKTISVVPEQNENNIQNSVTQNAYKYLTKTKEIFQQHANQYQSITINQAPSLLTQTYAALGRSGYYPNQQDIRVWMKLCDGNNDGHVEYEQFQHFVVRSLQRLGIKVFI